MPSRLVGVEVHGVVTLVELISLVLRTGCVGLDNLIEARRPSHWGIGNQLQPGSNWGFELKVLGRDRQITKER